MTDQHCIFTTWLKAQRGRDDAVGDLARDAAADPHWPKAAKSLPRLLDYLAGRGACPGAVEACRRAWAEFRAEGPRSPTGHEGAKPRRLGQAGRAVAPWANVARQRAATGGGPIGTSSPMAAAKATRGSRGIEDSFFISAGMLARGC